MKHLLILFGLIFLTLFPAQALAGDADSCRAKINFEIAREQRLYRSYLFGKRSAVNAPVGDVRYDNKGRAWRKASNSNDPWVNSVVKGHALGWRWKNTDMDANDEHAEILPLKGIFETKRVSTSELIPSLLQSIRALDCRLQALSEIARISEMYAGDDPVTIARLQPIGCIEFTSLETWPQCHFGKPSESLTDQQDSRSYSKNVSDKLLTREVELLTMIVEYDAGYRTLLQFAGNFDIFLREMRWPITGTLRKAVDLIGQLERIPCFLSSCDSAPQQSP